MKQFLLTFLFLFGVELQSQTTNYAQHSAIRETYNIVSINNKSYYLVSDFAISSCCSEKVKLIAHDATGKKLSENIIGQMGLVNRAQIAVMANKTLLIQFSSPRYQCDTGGPLTYLCNYDTLGNMLWSRTYPKQMGAALCKSDGSFFIVRSDSLLHYNVNGQVITKFILNGGQYQYGACLTVSGNIVYSKFTGSNSVVEKIDTVANVVTSQNSAIVFTDLYELSNAELVGASGGQALKMNANLLPIAGSSINTVPFNVRTTYVKSDTIYAAGLNSSGNLFFTYYDINFNIVNTVNSNLESVIPTGLVLANDKKLRLLASSSSEISFNNSHTFSSFFQFNKNGSLMGTKDIGVIDAQMLDYQVVHNSPIGKLSITYSAQVTVKNFGTDSLQYFKLNFFAKSSGISDCLLGLQQAYSITIPPGGTLTVLTNPFSTAPVPMSILQSSTIVSGVFCFYTSVPDSSSDAEVSNNSTCKSFTFSLLNTSVEHESLQLKTSIFPNPTNGQLSINANEDILELCLLDNLGRVVITARPINEAYSMNCTTLAHGIYFLSIKTENTHVMKKILIE